MEIDKLMAEFQQLANIVEKNSKKSNCAVLDWKNEVPHSNSPGVYIIYSRVPHSRPKREWVTSKYRKILCGWCMSSCTNKVIFQERVTDSAESEYCLYQDVARASFLIHAELKLEEKC